MCVCVSVYLYWLIFKLVGSFQLVKVTPDSYCACMALPEVRNIDAALQIYLLKISY